MYNFKRQDGVFQFTLQGVEHALTQDELDHLVGNLIPYITPKERYILALFQNLPPEEREKIGWLMTP